MHCYLHLIGKETEAQEGAVTHTIKSACGGKSVATKAF